MSDRKGMTMALGVIIAIVVLIVVALAVIAITSSSLSIFGGNTARDQAMASVRAQCETWFTQWCLSHPGQDQPPADEYPGTITVKIAGEDVPFECSQNEILGSRKCGGG